MPDNPFDFTDLSDLPEELQKKLHTDTSENARTYADVVLKGAEAGHPELEINQIMAAAIRMGIEVPTQQTVRNYLNAAVKLGLIAKPSRQTYGAPPTDAPKKTRKTTTKSEATVSNDPVTTSEQEVDNDPLADLGF